MTCWTSEKLNQMTQNAKNRVERWIDETSDHGLPVPGLEIEAGRTAVVITDPQNDFLHEDGVAWGVVGESARENNTIDNLKNLMETAVDIGMPLVISPHYYYPTDYGWTLKGGTLEKLMHDIHMYNRKGSLTLDGFENSGADWLEALKPAINHDKTPGIGDLCFIYQRVGMEWTPGTGKRGDHDKIV